MAGAVLRLVYVNTSGRSMNFYGKTYDHGALIVGMEDEHNVSAVVSQGAAFPVVFESLPEDVQADYDEAYQTLRTPAEAPQDYSDGGDSPEGDSGAQTASESEQEGGVPEGSIPVVLEWVGDSTDRAQAALDAEQAKDDPRSTLVDALEDLLTS